MAGATPTNVGRRSQIGRNLFIARVPVGYWGPRGTGGDWEGDCLGLGFDDDDDDGNDDDDGHDAGGGDDDDAD